MKQVLQNRTGLTVVRDVPPPVCSSGSVLVQNEFSAISSGTERSRVETSQKSLLGKARARPDLVRQVTDRARREGVRSTAEAVRRKLSQETPVGYSSAGRVLEVGGGVHGFMPGDLVACAGADHANHAEIVSVPANLVAKVPDGVPLEAAAMTTIAAIPLHGIRLAHVQLGDWVAVIGCGLVGQIACRLLQAAGATVVALDIERERVDQALAAGAHAGLVSDSRSVESASRLTNGRGVDHVLVTAAAPSSDPLLLAAEIARDRGTIILVGDVPVSFPRAALYDKELAFRISRSYGPGRYDQRYEEKGLDYPIGYVRWTEQRNMEAVLALQSSGQLDLSDLIEVVPVDEAQLAYERLVDGSQRPTGALVLSYGAEAGGVEPRSVAVPSMPPSQPRRHTQEQVRIGLIGPGNFAARVLVPGLVAAGAKLEVVGGGAGPSAEAAGRRLGFARVAETGEAVIADEAVDAVVIATRHATHASLVASALDAGKHVFCEKPLALSVEELENVLDAAARSDGVLAVGFNRRYSPLLREARAFLSSLSVPLASTYRVSAGRLPADHWTHDLDAGGGRILGEACHFVDSLTFLAGSPVTQVSTTGYGDPTLPVQAHDNVSITLRFASQSVGSILYVSDGSGRLAKERLEAFAGTRTAILDDYRRLDLFTETGRETKKLRTQDKGHSAELQAFLVGIAAGELPVPLSEIANVSLATLAAVESLRTGQPVLLGDA
jgi:predicted dehydrogenase/threonine dehydrogenase-like Zn-dependent dehydrogenase